MKLPVQLPRDKVAAALAERAVAATDRRNPDLLDTLAEALFALGDIPGALIAIDEAIDLSGGERYFVEQRRRFIGERAADDRPEALGHAGTKRPGVPNTWDYHSIQIDKRFLIIPDRKSGSQTALKSGSCVVHAAACIGQAENLNIWNVRREPSD